MRYRVVLMSVICVISGFLLMGKADAQLWWYGFSGLGWKYLHQGGPTNGAFLLVEVKDFTVRVACQNENDAHDDWKGEAGEGHFGDLLFTSDVVGIQDATGRKKGVVFSEGEVDLSIYDWHYLNGDVNILHINPSADPPVDNHICLATGKIEIPGSVHIPRITTVWKYVACKDEDCTRYRIVEQGNQLCHWLGTVDPVTGLTSPPDNGDLPDFWCEVDNVF